MKSSFAHQNSAGMVRALVAAVTLLIAVAGRTADNTVVKPPQGVRTPPVIDPATGLPLPPPVWIDPNWKEPDKILPEVNYDALPLPDVVEYLRQEFKGAFDILLPSAWPDPKDAALIIEPQMVTIKMQLRNVTASEVFNAMNLMFEAQNEPYRWELKLNGNRSTAILRILPQSPPAFAPLPLLPKTRMVYFVGDL